MTEPGSEHREPESVDSGVNLVKRDGHERVLLWSWEVG